MPKSSTLELVTKMWRCLPDYNSQRSKSNYFSFLNLVLLKLGYEICAVYPLDYFKSPHLPSISQLKLLAYSVYPLCVVFFLLLFTATVLL